MDLGEHGFETLLEGFVFDALVEFADKVAADFERVVAELQGCAAEVLEFQSVELGRSVVPGVPRGQPWLTMLPA